MLDAQAKADYDRRLRSDNTGSQPASAAEAHQKTDHPPDELQDYSLAVPPEPPRDHSPVEPSDEPQFEPLPNELIAANWPVPGKKRKTRVLFWTFTIIEGLCAVGLYFWLRPVEPIAMPKLPVRGQVGNAQPKVTNPVSSPVVRSQREPIRRRPARDPFAPDGDTLPGDSSTPPDSDSVPASPESDMNATAMASPAGSPSEPEGSPTGESPPPIRPSWPREWTLRFPANGDWAIDNEMLSLDAKEIKALSALREQPIYALRDVSTKTAIAALPFDVQGHLNGVAIALLPKDDWRACLTYNNQVLQGWAMVLDAQRQCVCFGDYRAKGRAKLLCLCRDGVPIAVQIWRGKESSAYLIELDEGRPVAHDSKQLSPGQAERLAAAVAELASIEALIRDCERDWKHQLTEWWSRHDNALRIMAAQAISDSEKQSRRNAYYKNLFDEQHSGLDKLLAQFGFATAEPTAPAP